MIIIFTNFIIVMLSVAQQVACILGFCIQLHRAMRVAVFNIGPQTMLNTALVVWAVDGGVVVVNVRGGVSLVSFQL